MKGRNREAVRSIERCTEYTTDANEKTKLGTLFLRLRARRKPVTAHSKSYAVMRC